MRAATPLSIGLRAARANLWPGLGLQIVMALVVAAYFRAGWAKPWFDEFALLKARGGFLFSMAAAAVAGALLPEALIVIFFQRGRATKRNGANLCFGLVFWAAMGFCVDLLYRGQSRWFGSELTAAVLVKKVLVDQFIYNPVFSAPVTVWCYEWRNRRYQIDGLGQFFTGQFYVGSVLPTLVATWGVWIPAVTLIYCLPPLLQIPLYNLALTFWALMLAYINSNENRSEDAVPVESDKLSS